MQPESNNDGKVATFSISGKPETSPHGLIMLMNVALTQAIAVHQSGLQWVVLLWWIEITCH